MYSPPNKEEWVEAFNSKFSELEDRPLARSLYPSLSSQNPLEFDGKGEAKYQCSSCSIFWFSMNGKVAATYCISLKSLKKVGMSYVGLGELTLKVFGQQCQRCNQAYEPAEHVPEAIDDILEKLLDKVKEKFYGEEPRGLGQYFKLVDNMHSPPNKEEWVEAFNSKFSELEDRPLPRSSYPSFFSQNPLEFDRKGEAKYQCSSCSRFWFSMNGEMAATYRISLERVGSHYRGSGEVTLKVFGQQCQRCIKDYEPAEHVPEAIDEILEMLLHKVKENFYDGPSRELGSSYFSISLGLHTPPNKEEWVEAFNSIFSELEDRPLARSSYPSFFSQNPLEFDRKGEAKYQCSSCSRYWYSMNGKMAATYRISLKQVGANYVGSGEVTLKVFGQQCQRCNKDYEPAAHVPEAIDDILEKLLHKVKEKFYGEEPRGPGRPYVSRMKKDHDKARCEACKYGCCDHDGISNSGRSTYGTRSLSSTEEVIIGKLISPKIKWTTIEI